MAEAWTVIALRDEGQEIVFRGTAGEESLDAALAEARLALLSGARAVMITALAWDRAEAVILPAGEEPGGDAPGW